MVPEFRKLYSLLVLAMALVAACIVFDFGFLQPRLADVGRLRTRYLQLTEERNELANQNQEHQNLTRSLKLEEVSEIFVDENKSDPAVFISDLLRESELSILELSAIESKRQSRLRRAGFAVRVHGDFGRILGLVRNLEKQTRLVTVDAFNISPAMEGLQLEGRFELSVYDPVVNQ